MPQAGELYWTEERREDALDRLFANVAAGVSVSRSLALLEDMPSPAEFWRWHMADQAIRDNLARARENGVEALLEQARDIASSPMEGEEITEMAADEDSEGTVIKRVRKDMLGHRRLVVDTYVKYAQMIAPRKYGPKLDLTTDNKPLQNLDDAAARAAALLAVARERKGKDE